MSKIKKDRKNALPNPYARHIVVPFKVNSDEMRELIKKAHGFAKGNISAWVRFAALNFKPKKEDFEK